MIITKDISYIGVNDYKLDLFEGIYHVPNGMSYNSYVILDEKIAIMDTVDVAFTEQWLSKVENVLEKRMPDYLIIHHMEPDHSANIKRLVEKYPDIMLVASAKAFAMMEQFFGTELTKNQMTVSDGDVLVLGKHTLEFYTAQMVHWPEVIMTYDCTEQVLFSADAFGKFGALDVEDEWIVEARRYYFGIVGKYGVWVQKILEKLADKQIQKICPLHGPVLTEDIEKYVSVYDMWSKYQPEEDGILIAYTSVYENTKNAVMYLVELLHKKGCHNLIVRDLARADMSYVVADAFRFSKLVLATTTYNAELFPAMRDFISDLLERNFCNREVALIENGSWAPIAAMLMRQRLEKCKGIQIIPVSVKLLSAMKEENKKQLEVLVEELCSKHEEMR